MSKFSVKIVWNVREINKTPTHNLEDVVKGNTVDEVLERQMQDLEKEYNTHFSYETYAEHNVFRRHERFYHEQTFAGIITVSLVTP